MNTNPSSLDRFLQAQIRDYGIALDEIRSGHKRSHWIWYIFPQIQGLGYSPMAQRYAIQDMDEAIAYLRNPLLAERLIEISNALLNLDSSDPTDVMGYPDDLKLKSSMTLFKKAAAKLDPDHNKHPEFSVFQQVLDKYFGGKEDQKTMQILNLTR